MSSSIYWIRLTFFVSIAVTSGYHVRAAEPEVSSSVTPTPSSALSLQIQSPSGSVRPSTVATGPQETPSSAVENSVVKVFSTARYPDFYKPWEKMQPTELSGSGVVIEGKRILTNAHVILHATQVQIQASQGGDKISATVEAFAPGIDLAVLKLDDEKFFDSHPVLQRAQTLPQIRDAVTVYGYPTGGTRLSVTTPGAWGDSAAPAITSASGSAAEAR